MTLAQRRPAMGPPALPRARATRVSAQTLVSAAKAAGEVRELVAR
jgi:hypothetical protein